MSFRNPAEFEQDLDALEEVERATARLLAAAIHNLLGDAAYQFEHKEVVQGETDYSDLANYVGEDITRMALDAIGPPKVPGGRLFGAIDFKQAALQFLPNFAVRQALFVDSKAEKGAYNNARIQVTQTSLEIRQERAGEILAIPGRVEPIWNSPSGDPFLTTTCFVKYHYSDASGDLKLRQITTIILPNRFLQSRYNPSASDDIWNAGPDAPRRGEKFRTRLNFTKLEMKARWRIQRMKPSSPGSFEE